MLLLRFFCIVLAIEISCPPVAFIKNGFPDSNDNVIESVITYSCLSGYQFPDGTTVRTAVCFPNQTWSTAVDDCLRKNFILCFARYLVLYHVIQLF